MENPDHTGGKLAVAVDLLSDAWDLGHLCLMLVERTGKHPVTLRLCRGIFVSQGATKMQTLWKSDPDFMFEGTGRGVEGCTENPRTPHLRRLEH